jgi:D-alanyl-D-alanine carboxypeptidase
MVQETSTADTRRRGIVARRGRGWTVLAGVLAIMAMLGVPQMGWAQGPDGVGARLQAALDAGIAGSRGQLPGVIVYLRQGDREPWIAAAGVADIATGAKLTVDARFRGGSSLKSLVAAVVLQLVEEGALSLDDTMTRYLPPDVTGRFANSHRITVRMLLNHTAGVPEWLTEGARAQIVANPAKVWDVSEFLDMAAAQPVPFAPGQGWGYSNTDYNLLGLIIERVTGKPWREAVTTRIIMPIGLTGTSLPEPGGPGLDGSFMHGYGLVGGKVADFSIVDSSMAGAAGGAALVTTVQDLAGFLAALRAGQLFRKPTTFADMATFVDAPDVGGQVGYGLGLQKYLLPGGVALIGHLGGTAGYRCGTFYFPDSDVSLAFAMSMQGDPSPVIAAALGVLPPR